MLTLSLSPLRYLAFRDSSSDRSDEVIERISDYEEASYSIPMLSRVDFVDEIGALTINFGVKGEKIEVLKSDALVLVTIIDGKIADIEILFSDKDAIKKLSDIFKPYSNRQ